MEFIFNFLNIGALLGWSFLLVVLLLKSAIDSIGYFGRINELVDPFFVRSSPEGRQPLIDLLLFLEMICFVEVGRIAIGQLKGNFTLGIILHMIRLTCLLFVFNHESRGLTDMTSSMILYSWALTEVGRYPMYVFPKSSMARNVRLVLPMFTFPVGCAAEFYSAYLVLTEMLTEKMSYDHGVKYWLACCLLGMVVFVNGLLGPTLAYPALVKKGLRVMTGKEVSKKKKS